MNPLSFVWRLLLAGWYKLSEMLRQQDSKLSRNPAVIRGDIATTVNERRQQHDLLMEGIKSLSKVKNQNRRQLQQLRENLVTVTKNRDGANMAKQQLTTQMKFQSREEAEADPTFAKMNGDYNRLGTKVESLTKEIKRLEAQVRNDEATIAKDKTTAESIEAGIKDLQGETERLIGRLASSDARKSALDARHTINPSVGEQRLAKVRDLVEGNEIDAEVSEELASGGVDKTDNAYGDLLRSATADVDDGIVFYTPEQETTQNQVVEPLREE